MRVVRTDAEIDAVLDLAQEGVNFGTKWRGMSYEQGVVAMKEWLAGDTDDNPMIDSGE